MFARKKFRHLLRKGPNLLVIAITIIAKLFVSLKHWKKHTILLPSWKRDFLVGALHFFPNHLKTASCF